MKIFFLSSGFHQNLNNVSNLHRKTDFLLPPTLLVFSGFSRMKKVSPFEKVKPFAHLKMIASKKHKNRSEYIQIR